MLASCTLAGKPALQEKALERFLSNLSEEARSAFTLSICDVLCGCDGNDGIMWLEADSEREVLEHGQFSIVFCKSITHTFASGTCCAKINLKPCPGFQILQTYHTYLKLGETLSEPFPIDCWQ
jgi:hypothetical protein